MKNPYLQLFNSQKENQFNIGNTNYKQRIKKLKILKVALEKTYKQDIREALYADFKKPYIETDLTELYLVIKEIKVAISNLKSWMRNKHVGTPLALLGTTSWIKYEPKGVCLIISPWNYPVNLTFCPLVSAIAAGNTVILKPSEMTPNTSRVMAKIVKDVFNENEIALVEGDVEVSKHLLKLPFNHIFFTGSPAVGKIIMEAASKHLASVTLELGGKSPTIVDETANVQTAVKSIVWGKYLNTGQTCIAPDYVLVHESKKEAFIEAFKMTMDNYYSKKPEKSKSFGRVVNEKHFKRLTSYIEAAKEDKAIIHKGGNYNANDNYIEPTLISKIPERNPLLNEEIFGPILPIKTYKNLNEVVSYINSKARPLALYMYSKSKKNTNYVIKNTRSGGTCINSTEIHFINHELPFGGINNSGIGKSHSYFGFKAFSNERAVLKSYWSAPLKVLFPPYTNFKQKVVDFIIKWL
ncbi:aldehyde dehydrogenase family protein [Neotamlana laminarinivorans]|uniref:Aldehyde dehydrogenase n=1 Tax=Neotamlana laminarinivorans TaxID=2883124 RepID=A0A9X1L4U7_9FLAO|nr:aldehyde dehydrogenase family protein [Tamlana laminarinivorans]MCB4799859.1 aldehyde dehydrogenase family protein [Tamlana laminarinivorans]